MTYTSILPVKVLIGSGVGVKTGCPHLSNGHPDSRLVGHYQNRVAGCQMRVSVQMKQCCLRWVASYQLRRTTYRNGLP